MSLRIALLVYVAGEKQPQYGGEHDAGVEGETLPVDILHVQLEFLLHGETGASTDLGQTGEARFDQESAALVFVPFGNLAEIEGSWAYQRQFSPQDVPELRQFVEGKSSQDLSDGGEAGIGAAFGGWAEAIDISPHGAELAEVEGMGVFSGALLGEEHGGAGGYTEDSGYKYCKDKY